MSNSRIVKRSPQIQTILVGGSNSACYERIKAHEPTTKRQKCFLEGFLEALGANVPNFRVPVYDPSIDYNNETINFVPGAKPAISYSYEELERMAQKNNLKLGSKYQYHLFIATMILRIMDKEGFSEEKAWEEMCDYSKFCSEEHEFQLTGSYPIAGKYDLGMTFKVLKKTSDSKECWIAGKCYYHVGGLPVADIFKTNIVSIRGNNYCSTSVGWFVLDENDERALNAKKVTKESAIYSNKIKNKSNKMSAKYETISVYGSRSIKYERLIMFKTDFKPYKDFQEMLKYVMGIDIPGFRVPVYFPTLDENGLLQFIYTPGKPEYKEPLKGLSYIQCKELAKKSGIRLGTRNQYILFIATLILNLIDLGKSEEEAWENLFNYLAMADDKLFECIRGNQYKILDTDEENDTYCLVAGGRFFVNGNANTIWFIYMDDRPDISSHKAVGWFVF